MLKKLSIIVLVSLFALPINTSYGKDNKKTSSKTRKIQINGTMGETTSKLIVKAEGLYLMGDNDTPAYSREMCLINAKKIAAENAMSKIKSETLVINGVVERDEIKVNADADVSVLSTKFAPVVNNEYRAEIEAEVKINDNPQKDEVKEIEVYQEEGLKVFISTPKDNYHEGEKMSFKLYSTKDAYIRVKYKSVDGEVLQLIPNKFHKENFVKAYEEIELPQDLGKNYNFEVIEPFGEELLIVEACEKAFKVQLEDNTLDGKIKIVGNYEDEIEFSTSVIKINTSKKPEGSSRKK
jgi:hypothetical protein